MNDDNISIDELIQMLHSPVPATREEACLHLRDLPQIPIDAVQALQEAANDPDEGVASAARWALRDHLPLEATPEPGMQELSGAPIIGSVVGQAAPTKHFIWYQAWIKATMDPRVASFQELLDDPAASPRRGLTWIGAVSLVFGFFIALFIVTSIHTFLFKNGSYDPIVILLYVACGMTLVAILMMLGIVLSTAILNLFARSLGGEGNYTKLVYLVSAFSAPLLLISGLFAYNYSFRSVSYLIGFYMIILSILSIMTVYKFSVGKALLTYFISNIVEFVVVACIIALTQPVFKNLIEQGYLPNLY